MTNPLHVGKPNWLKTSIPTGSTFFAIKKDLRSRGLFTVCEEAKCPNIGECWNTKTATFMVLGDTCTRGCRFCHVKTGNPGGLLNEDEPQQVAESAAVMGLKYAVITMVDRDDLADGGAGHLGAVVRAVREKVPGIAIELLTGDFAGKDSSLEKVLVEKPEVFAHNIETVERLSPRVRDGRAAYRRSLQVLQRVKEKASYEVLTKSAIMLGLGEEEEDIEKSLKDLREHGVDIVTLGQYMRPTPKHLSIKRFATPEEFAHWQTFGESLGFKAVVSAPLVRSSYKARDYFEQATGRTL